MPKSKNRKSRYARRQHKLQVSSQAQATPVPVAASGEVSAVKPSTLPRGRLPARPAPTFEVANISTELKVIGIITLLILAAIFVAYIIIH